MSCNIPELRSEIAKSPAKLNAVMSANGVPSRSKLNAATSKINGIKSDGTMVPADVVIVTCVAASDWWAAPTVVGSTMVASARASTARNFAHRGRDF